MPSPAHADRLILPPGHRLTITVDGDAPMAVTIAAYRGDEWLGNASVASIGDVAALQEIADMLTKRGIRRASE
jgi:hypothetical protein